MGMQSLLCCCYNEPGSESEAGPQRITCCQTEGLGETEKTDFNYAANSLSGFSV